MISKLCQPYSDWLFRDCSRKRGGAKRVHLPKICHTYPIMMKLGPKEDPKNIWITWHTPWVLLTSAFLHGKSANLLYQEIHLHIAFWFIISIYFNFYWIFIDCFNNMVKILMMSPKMATPGLLKIKGILKKRLLRHIFCIWHHQQNFFTWLKFYCGCGHVTKFW